MRIHWLSVTVYRDYEYCSDLWQEFFNSALGLLIISGRAGRGFQRMDTALNEARLYSSPIPQSNLDNRDYCHYDFPGSACDCVIPLKFSDFISFLKSDGVEFNVTRIDLAFDEVPFTPLEFYNQIVNDGVVSYVKRETLTIDSSPFALRDDGNKGCDTVYFGSKSSDRLLRVYNKRGFTRLELVCKGDRAQAVALDIFENLYRDWNFVAREHVRQYVNFPEWQSWHEFIGHAHSADIIISSSRRSSLSKMQSWLDRQVSVSLSVLMDVYGTEDGTHKINEMIYNARNNKDRSRYASVLQDGHPFTSLKTLLPPDLHSLIPFDLDDDYQGHKLGLL